MVLTLPGRKILHNVNSGEAATFLQQQPVVSIILQLIEKVHLDDLDLYVITFAVLATSV